MKIYHYILFAMLFLVASCSSTDEPEVASGVTTGGGETCELVVSFKAEQTNVRRSPSIWGDPYPEEEGTPDESEIRDMYLYFVSPDDVVYPLTPTLIGETSSDDFSKVYEYKVTINLRADYVVKNADGTKYLSGRIVAMANMPDGMPATPFEHSKFDISLIDETQTIPMWGVETLTNLRLESDKTVASGKTIRLLRAVPKFAFELADDLKNEYKITSVTSPYDGFEQTGYCQPAGGLTVSATSNLLIEGCFNPHDSEDKVLFPGKIYGIGSQKVWMYTPEFLAEQSDNGQPPYFEVTLQRYDGAGFPFTGRVYLCDYQDGEPKEGSAFEKIVRNHDYQYIISLRKLEFIISFHEWIFGGKVHIELE